MNLTAIPPHVRGWLAADGSALKALPLVDQLDPEYNTKFEAALRDPGVALVLWLTGGEPSDGARDKHMVALDNMVVIAVVENPVVNTTKKTALEWTELLMTTLHHAGFPKMPGRSSIFLDQPGYDLGPLRTGLTTYFVTFRVKSENRLTPSVS